MSVPSQRRSQDFFTEEGVAGFTHRAMTKAMGFDDTNLRGGPVIGICNTYSELNNCHSNFNTLCEAVKRGVLQAGGTPLEFPTISLGETFLTPTSMLQRNLAAMDTEEMIRSQPLDGVVLLTGCDKTTPAALMGAISADLPAIMVSGGPQLNGYFRGETLGACTDCRRLTAEHRAGEMDDQSYKELEDGIVRGPGHCMVMGTASTMNSITEALGMALPGNGNIPAVDARRLQHAQAAGRRITAMAEEDLRPSRILTEKAFENALTLLSSLGGSTNAVVHLPAIAGRAGIDLPLELFDEISRRTPILANTRPVGQYQMQELHNAGGIPGLMRRLLPLLHGDELTVTGRSITDNVHAARVEDSDVIRPLDNPVHPHGGIAVLRGNLAPEGAVVKHVAASPELSQHRGRAVVFEDVEDLKSRIDRDDLGADASSVLMLRNAGPLGGPGMPEVGNLPIPKNLLRQGVRDMVRISDGRMSGTAFGTVILHAAPESAAGGPLALVRDGDEIELDIPNRRLALLVDDTELERRRAEWSPPAPAYRRGYGRLFLSSVNQAPHGCDFDFLTGRDPVGEYRQPKF
ncbi:dihydroxy-acid dehydratase [Lipingzhangella halophila]|uniref:Dihydroxy-acid dehydratase n=1 Tax=Lipingzhangella halophila TaxID=1783352 RepID=A0A7W7RK78_9ACTN|nr:IlvD/Edd family dehydratase [Lipingzhangella halophila]MBB4933352.1 dihydroxy-acid dehydratase [Lipingzhangella halophila]